VTEQTDREKMIETARKLQEQADALLAAAGVDDTVEDKTDESAAPGRTATPTPSGASPEGNDGETGAAETEPVTNLPGEEDESEEAKIDPPEVMDMRDELAKVRDLLARKGFHRRESSAAGEVWERSGPRGEPGFRATLVSTPHGRIRMELRDPAGLIRTQAEPATEVDCEIALAGVA
jgi:hypothetical protein